MKNQDYEISRKKLSHLVESVTTQFTKGQCAEVVEFIDVNEFGLALETLIAIILEENKTISLDSFQCIEELAAIMGMTKDVDWDDLRKHIRKSS